MTTLLKNRGYYNFSKENFYFLVDTTIGNNQVDLTISLNNPIEESKHQQYTIGDVMVFNGLNSEILDDPEMHYLLDTIDYRGIKIVQERNPFLSARAIYYNTFIRPGRLYSDRIVERTYSSLNGSYKSVVHKSHSCSKKRLKFN